jgi:amino acid transporter
MNNAEQIEKNDKRFRLITYAVVSAFAVFFIWNIYNSRFEIQIHTWSIIILLAYIMFVMLTYIIYRLYILEQLMIKTLRSTKSQ